MSTHNLYFEQKYRKYQSFSFENFQFLEVKSYIYLNRHVFVMLLTNSVNEKLMIFFPEKQELTGHANYIFILYFNIVPF